MDEFDRVAVPRYLAWRWQPTERTFASEIFRSAACQIVLRLSLLVVGIFGWTPPIAAADTQPVCIQPSAEVETALVVRQSATIASAPLDRLLPGAQVRVLGEVPHWYLVELADGKNGFTAKNWARVSACDGKIPKGGSYELHAIDVGTGLALFVRGADFSLLYDAGSNDDVAGGAKNRVLAYLAEKFPGLKRIDHVILSHPHRDHLELMADVFAAYEVGDVWDSGAVHTTCSYRDFIRAIANESGARYHTALQNFGQSTSAFDAGCRVDQEMLVLRHGARIDTDPVTLGAGAAMQFLYTDGSKHSDLNDNSLVVRLDLGPHAALLTGDAGGGSRKPPSVPPSPKSIEAILLSCCTAELKADVLIAGHHGSMTSSRSTFLDAVGAKTFVVSSGPFKYSGTMLPDPEVIAELDRRGDVWRTDVDDAACAANPEKTGPDADKKPGGCNDVVVRFSTDGITADYASSSAIGGGTSDH